jgi:hypothetical protein
MRVTYNDPMNLTYATDDEIWKPVNSTGGLLEASSLGRIRRVARPLIYSDGRRGELPAGILNGCIGKVGYVFVSLGKKKFLAHRLVAEAFHGLQLEDFAKQTVNHINGDKLDNRPENLEWSSYKANNHHARETGLNRQHGENTNLSKHSAQFIQAVRNVYAKYKPSYAELGRLFGLRDGHAGQIVKGKTRVNG